VTGTGEFSDGRRATAGRPRPVLGLLGDFQLTCGEVNVDASPSAQRLLALLALSGRPVARDYAAGQLWPDVGATRAAGSLRTSRAGSAALSARCSWGRRAQTPPKLV
jgi:hypothetical protein